MRGVANIKDEFLIKKFDDQSFIIGDRKEAPYSREKRQEYIRRVKYSAEGAILQEEFSNVVRA